MAQRNDIIRHGITTVIAELTAHAARIAEALDTMADDIDSGLRGTDATTHTGGGRSSDTTDTTAGTATGNARDRARDDRRTVDHLTRDLLESSRRLGAIIDTYNPNATQLAEIRGNRTGTNDQIWCVNHRQWGEKETREQGSDHCRWCRFIRGKYGKYPNGRLIDHHARNSSTPASVARRLLASDTIPSNR